MKNALLLLGCIHLLLVAGISAAGPGDDALGNWPQWRGPLATGEAPGGNPPIRWSETANVRWKIPIPGKGLATPVIWKDQIFILTAVETDKKADAKNQQSMPLWMRTQASTTNKVHAFTILSLNRKDGKTRWHKVLREQIPFSGTHNTGSWASNSPVTDGEYVYAYFGSYGLYCLDMDGDTIWEKDLGDMETRNSFGEGSSPALYEDKLVINWDHEGASFIAVMDKNTGDILWKKERDERTSWSTPLVVDVNGKPQIIVNATGRSRGYDLDTGDVIWESGGMTVNVIPSPVYADGIVYLMSGFRGSALQAIRLDKARGDLSGSDAVVWTHDANTPYTPSPLLYRGALYFLKINQNILSCFDAGTGQPTYESERLEGLKGVYASPAAANGRVYVVGRNGATAVLKHGSTFEVLAVNALDEGIDASPVIVGDELYLRGLKHLYCIAED